VRNCNAVSDVQEMAFHRRLQKHGLVIVIGVGLNRTVWVCWTRLYASRSVDSCDFSTMQAVATDKSQHIRFDAGVSNRK
jgi:hypothetical protein